ncbi:MAG: TonB-dependent receptor [Gemmatimonadaceae bacterium]
MYNPSRSNAGARIVRRLGVVAALLVSAVAAPSDLMAQGGTGSIAGVITDAAHVAVAGAQVNVVGTRLAGVSDLEGRYRVNGVPVGTQELRIQRIGQRPQSVSNVDVRAGAETKVDISVIAAPTSLSAVVVSASRRVEKVTDAPATITSISTEQLDNSVGNSIASAFKEVKGLDFIQVGMTAVAVNARGFNSSFNSRVLFVEDGRISVIPESGLPTGSLTPISKVDLAGVEVLVGPGSALYGPDAANGVISTRTKDPRQYPGLTLEVAGGNRGYKDVQGRYAGVTNNLGYKVTGEYQDANDWNNNLSYNSGGTIVAAGTAGSVKETDLKIPIDWKSSVARGTGALVYYMNDNRLSFDAGMSKTNGVAQTSVGRNQLTDWGYNYLQARYTTPHLYFNAYREQSTSGKSFALNRFAGQQLTAANASLTPDSLRLLADWPSDGRLMAAEAQANYIIAPALNTALVFGAQYRDDVVSSDRQWLTDRVTKKDISNTQKGYYAQTTTPFSQYLDVVLAGRLDYPTTYDKQFSPKAGVVVKPMADQAFRVTYNRAYKSPTILQTNFFIPDWTSIISIYGNTDGFTVKNAAGATTATFKPLVPETNKTWEFGYKGVLARRVYLDGTYYHSNYENFLSPLAVIANPFTGAAATFASPTANPNGIPVNAAGNIVNAAGVTPVMLTYFNIGAATISGVDIGANVYATDKLELRGTLSTVKLSNLNVPAVYAEATALNAPGTKWTLGATMRDIGPATAGMTFRNVNSYFFRSGSNLGVIPTFGTLDASVNVKAPAMQNVLVNLSVSNLFSCTANSVTYVAGTTPANSQIATEDRGCGFNRKHSEMVNMPQIGTMLFLGMRISR